LLQYEFNFISICIEKLSNCRRDDKFRRKNSYEGRKELQWHLSLGIAKVWMGEIDIYLDKKGYFRIKSS